MSENTMLFDYQNEQEFRNIARRWKRHNGYKILCMIVLIIAQALMFTGVGMYQASKQTDRDLKAIKVQIGTALTIPKDPAPVTGP